MHQLTIYAFILILTILEIQTFAKKVIIYDQY